MNAASAALSAGTPKALVPILVGGVTAGILDLTSAFIIYGPGIPRVIAGRAHAFQGQIQGLVAMQTGKFRGVT
jgi:hypothetical protein